MLSTLKPFLFKPFNSQRLSTCNFSQKCPRIIQVQGYENIQIYQGEVVILKKKKDVWQPEERIDDQIMKVKGLYWRACSVKTMVLSKI